MSKELAERLKEHAHNLSIDRGLRREETDALDPPTLMEQDLMVASRQLLYYSEATNPNIALQDDLNKTNILLTQAVAELANYRAWAKQIKAALGAFPGGEL